MSNLNRLFDFLGYLLWLFVFTKFLLYLILKKGIVSEGTNTLEGINRKVHWLYPNI